MYTITKDRVEESGEKLVLDEQKVEYEIITIFSHNPNSSSIDLLHCVTKISKKKY